MDKSTQSMLDQITLTKIILPQRVRTDVNHLVKKGLGNLSILKDAKENILCVNLYTTIPIVIGKEETKRKYYLDARVYTSRGYRMEFHPSIHERRVKSYTTIHAEPYLDKGEQASILLDDNKVRDCFRAVDTSIDELCAMEERSLNLSSTLILQKPLEFKGFSKVTLGNTSAINAYRDIINYLNMRPRIS